MVGVLVTIGEASLLTTAVRADTNGSVDDDGLCCKTFGVVSRAHHDVKSASRFRASFPRRPVLLVLVSISSISWVGNINYWEVREKL